MTNILFLPLLLLGLYSNYLESTTFVLNIYLTRSHTTSSHTSTVLNHIQPPLLRYFSSSLSFYVYFYYHFYYFRFLSSYDISKPSQSISLILSTIEAMATCYFLCIHSSSYDLPSFFEIQFLIYSIFQRNIC